MTISMLRVRNVIQRKALFLTSALSMACLASAQASAAAACIGESSFALPNRTEAVNSAGFAAAITAAKVYFSQDSNQCRLTDFTINVAGGSHDLSAERRPLGNGGLIEFDNINPPAVASPSGPKQLHLILQGVGSGARGTGLAAGRGLGANYVPDQQWANLRTQTTLITDKSTRGVWGKASSHIVIRGMTMMQNYPTASQGIVVRPYGAEPRGLLTLDIQPGYAPPTAEFVDCHGKVVYKARSSGCSYEPGLRNAYSVRNFVNDAHVESARLLRVYDNSDPRNPVLDQSPDNHQIVWGYPADETHGWQPSTQPDPANHPNRWTLSVRPNIEMPSVYTQGALVCIKSKIGGYLGMMFVGPGSDIVIDDIRWIGDGEAAFLGNTSTHSGMVGVKVLNSENVRANPLGGQRQCIASSFGGLQMGGPKRNGATGGNVINNYYAENTGDDAVAFFDDNPKAGLGLSYIANSTINNSFARTIFSFRSKVSNVTEANMNIVAGTCNAGLLNDKGWGPGCPVLSAK